MIKKVMILIVLNLILEHAFNESLDACLNANLQIRKYLNNIPQNDLKLCSKLGYDKNQGYELDLKCEQIFIKYLSCFGQIFLKKAD